MSAGGESSAAESRAAAQERSVPAGGAVPTGRRESVRSRVARKIPDYPFSAMSRFVTTFGRALRGWPGGLAERHGGRWVVVCLAVVVAVGFGLRIDSALHPHARPGPDERAYAGLAKSLYERGEYSAPGVRYPDEYAPGPALYYSAVYFVTAGVHPETGLVLAAILGGFSVLLIYLLARRLAAGLPGRNTQAVVGLLAAVIAALYLPFIAYDGRIMSESIAVFTVPATILAALRATERRTVAAWFVPGVLLGITALGRPEILVVALVVAALACYRVARDRRFVLGLAAALVVLSAAALPVLPWTVRNALVLDRFVPVSAGGGKALYLGTSWASQGIYTRLKERLMAEYPDLRRPEFRGHPVTRAERETTNIEPFLDRVAAKYPGLPRDAALGRIARENLADGIVHHPGAVAKMFVLKVWMMWRQGSEAKTKPWIVYHRLLLLLGVVGFVVLLFRRRREVLFVGLPIVAVTAVAVLSLAVYRRAVPLMPLVIPLAAVGAVWVALQTQRLSTHVRRRLCAASDSAAESA